MKAEDINGVIAQLTTIADWAQQSESRLGYFAALYSKLSIAVRRGIETNFFDDGERMNHIGTVFANRYFAAFDQYQNGNTPSRAWLLAFEAAKQWKPTVLQHLILGMNAHINLDLGIAVARSVTPETLDATRDDFNRINELIGQLIDEVENELAQIWPLTGLLDWVGGRKDEFLINFSLSKARDFAWKVAARLAPLDRVEQEIRISALDAKVQKIGSLVLRPGLKLRATLALVRFGERGTIPSIIEILK
jgi:hypothetical protein